MGHARLTNVDVVRESIRAINRGDLDEVMRFFTEDVVFDGTRIMEGTFEGKQPYRRFLESVLETVDIDYENVSYLTDEDRVIALADVVGSSASGIPMEGRIAFLYLLRDGRIYRQEVHPDAEALLREAGMDR